MSEPSRLAPEAWAEFEARLGTYVRARVDPGAAEDLVGDILLRLVEHQGALEAARNPTAWMFRVAANAVADHYRRRAAEWRALVQAGAEIDGDGRNPVAAEGENEHAAAARCLIPLIRDLPAPYGEALMLTDIEGLSQRAAAGRLGLSSSGMKSRVQRGRAKLKQALLRCCTVQTDRRGGVLDIRRRSMSRVACAVPSATGGAAGAC